MSLFSRRILLFLPLASLLALAACGFSPVYAPGGTASALRGKVEVAAPATVDSYLLVQNLENRLGRPNLPLYNLALILTIHEQGQAITAESEITRYSLMGQVDYVLRDIGGEAIIAAGSVNNFTGYSATGSTVETLAAERDARARLMAILAEQITTRLYATVDFSADLAQ